MNHFRNEPLLELRRATVRSELQDALTALDRRLPVEVPIIVDGHAMTAAAFPSVDPGHPERVVASAHAATVEHVDAAVAAAGRARASWGAEDPETRAATLARAAGVLRAQRLELAALAVRECGKPWAEADADVCEAIDFLEYYGQEAVRLAQGPQLVQLPGERNAQRYVARGVVAVVAPWNFPVAIPTGMVAAALAVGNGVVLKPAEQAPACAHAVVTALHQAGVPAEALHLLPGGDAPGSALVDHPDVHVIAFTGSCAVGLRIIERAASLKPGQRHVKRVVSEMGGKNCVIVDADADLDDAVPAIVTSAFGFAGQKCSAASRVLAHERIAATLQERLAGMVSTLRVGQAHDFGTDVPPVIDAASHERVTRCIERGREQGTIVEQARVDQEHGYFAPPTLVGALPPGADVLEQEIFGPLLTIESVPDVAAACDVVDGLSFALTGGLFTRSPATVDYVARRTPVGNLYVNREITGAMVGRQPFGGNRLSGSGAKAGGPDYLLQFVDARVTTENTVRHGLVV